jgi:hypothetical protein
MERAANMGHVEPITYRLSHIEVVTFDALTGIAGTWFGPGRLLPG